MFDDLLILSIQKFLLSPFNEKNLTLQKFPIALVVRYLFLTISHDFLEEGLRSTFHDFFLATVENQRFSEAPSEKRKKPTKK